MHRAGLFYCKECNGQFTVTVGTVLERSKIPLQMVLAMHLMAACKNGMSPTNYIGFSVSATSALGF